MVDQRLCAEPEQRMKTSTRKYFPTFPYISRITIRVLKHIWDLRSRLVESCRQQQAQTSWNDIKKDLCLAGLGGAVIKVNSYATGFFVNVI